MPIMFTTSSFDLGGAFDQANVTIAPSYQNEVNLFLGYNGMKKIDAFDFKTYPIIGFRADRMEHVTLNGEYENTTWYLNNADGVPMVAVNYTADLIHAKHYSRDQKTGAIKYDPVVK